MNSRLAFPIAVISLIVCRFFTIPVNDAMAHPLVAVFLNSFFVGLYLAVLYYIGVLIVVCTNKWLPIRQDLSQFSLVDFIVLGVLFSICIGIVGGISGILTPWYYLSMVVGLYVIALFSGKQSFQLNAGKISGIDKLVTIVLIVIFGATNLNLLIGDLVTGQGHPDFFIQYLPNIQAIIDTHHLLPSPIGLEIKSHEYYYAHLLSLPAVMPGFIDIIPFVNVCMTIFGCLSLYMLLKKLWGNALIAAAGVIFFAVTINAATFNNILMPAYKSSHVFLLVMIVFSMNFLLYSKPRNDLIFFASAVSSGLLCGTTLAGLYFATGVMLVLLATIVLRQMSLKRGSIFAGVVLILCLLPKMINWHYTNSPVDALSRCYIGIGIEHVFHTLPEFFSQIDRYFFGFWYGFESNGNRPSITINTVLTALFRYGGVFIVIAVITAFIFEKNKFSKTAYIIICCMVLPVLIFAVSLSDRFALYAAPWVAFCFSFLAFSIYRICNKSHSITWLNRQVIIVVVTVVVGGMFSSILLLDSRFSKSPLRRCFRIDITRTVLGYINLQKRAIDRTVEAGIFIDSERFRKIKSLFIPSELVFEFGNLRSPYICLSKFYGYTPIYYTNFLNKLMYYENPDSVLVALKKIHIRYIILSSKTCLLPKPTLFKDSLGGRYLKIVDSGPLFLNSIKGFPWDARIDSFEVLLEVLDSPATQDNIEIMSYIQKCNFNQDSRLVEALTNDELNESVFSRLSRNFSRPQLLGP